MSVLRAKKLPEVWVLSHKRLLNMNWQQDALDAISKAPALLRPMIKRKVEFRVAENGGSVVTLDDVNEARRNSRPRSQSAGETGVSAAEIERVVASTPQSSVVSDSRFYEIKVCGGAFGCPRTLFDVRELARKMVMLVENSGVAEAVASRVKGPVLRHHKFNVAIADCPNSCSQPQINDFGVQGRARVKVTDNPCIECMECVRVCGEGSVSVENAVVAVDRTTCINCGDCAHVCPTETLVVEETGYTVLAGGKLGRHPQLARELLEFTDEAAVISALEVCLEIFRDEIRPGERMADAVTRVSVNELLRRIAKGTFSPPYEGGARGG